MSSYKSTAALQFATSLDVRMLSTLLKAGIFSQPKDDPEILMPDQDIDHHIIKCSGYVNSSLLKISGGASGLNATAPSFGKPVNNIQNAHARSDQSPRLEGVTVATAAITELWTIRFTSVTAFKVYGSISGYQGSGLTTSIPAADFVSTNLDLTIPQTAWFLSDEGETYQAGDRVYVPVYKQHQSVVYNTALFTAADILDSFFSEISPNESKMAASMRARAQKWIDDLVSGKTRLSDAAAIPAYEFVEIVGGVTTLGDDVAAYQDDSTSKTVKDPFDNVIQ